MNMGSDYEKSRFNLKVLSESLAKKEDSDTDDDEYMSEDYDDDELMDSCPVKSLFSEKIFPNVEEMLTYEKEQGFNIKLVLKKFDMDMISYIKMINFIRLKKPDLEIFNREYTKTDQIPWDKDEFMKTTIEDDGALQFDVEEDLDMLHFDEDDEVNNNNVQKKMRKPSVMEVDTYRKKLSHAEAKIDELVQVVNKMRSCASEMLTDSLEQSITAPEDNAEDDSCYVNSYSNYSIHLEMLQDQVRTEGYMNAILNNRDIFKDKVVLDIGCGSGILSLFAAKAGAKLVIAVDMASIIDQAIQIAKENGYENKIVFLKGKMEEVKLPVDKVDIIISEWMGYFLLFESMLDAVIYARDKYLQPTTGLTLPNLFEMHLFGVSDAKFHQKTMSYWSDVYGFKMNCMKDIVIQEAQVTVIDEEAVATNLVVIKSIDCSKCSIEEISKFDAEFSLTIDQDCELTGLASSFDTHFTDSKLTEKNSFSTSPFNVPTHWQQTLFQFQEPVQLKKGTIINGRINCRRNPDYQRSYLVDINIFDKLLKYKVQ